jgi:HSP20 family protein
MPTKEANVVPAKVLAPARQDTAAVTPFRTFERFADEVSRIFDDFGFGRGLNRVPTSNEPLTWAPRIDITQQKNELVVSIDLPGVDKENVKVNVTEDTITVQGERHRAQEQEHDGVYRTERSYGAFFRTIALPAGTITDQAKASFKNGVLEIRMPAAPGVEGRALEIGG